MKKMDIVFSSVNDANNFINIANNMDGEVTLSSGRYRINAKSVMGVFTLDLSSPLCLEIENWKDEYNEMLVPYIPQINQG